MIIYYLYIIFAVLLSVLTLEGSKYQRKRVLAFGLWLGMFLIMGLRATDVGNDLERYIEYYSTINNIEVGETRTEPGYVIFLKFIDFVGLGERGYIMLTSFIISASFVGFFYKYSEKLTFTVILHVLIGLFAFSLTGIRQTLAICLTLFAFHFSMQRKLMPFLMFTFLATTFHNSAFIFFPVYWINKARLDSYGKVFVAVLLISVAGFFSQYIIKLFAGFSTEKYNDLYLDDVNASRLNLLPIIFHIGQVFSVVALWFVQKKRLYNVEGKHLIFFNLSLISAVFVIFAANISTIGRLGFYFTPYLVVLLPNVLASFNNRAFSRLIQIVIFIVSIAYFMIANIDGVLKIDDYSFGIDVFG